MAPQQGRDPDRMSFFEHLDALRPHLVRSVTALIVLFILAFAARAIIVDHVLMGPLSANFPLNRFFTWITEHWGGDSLQINSKGFSMINTALAGQFNLHMKISFVTAFSLAVPYILWELWRFVKPALTPDELKAGKMFVFYVSCCFFAGLLFGYFIISPLTVNFFSSYVVSQAVVNMIDVNSYLSTVVNVSIACAVVFQLPVLIYFLSRMGLITSRFMRRYRKHAVVVLVVFSAIITPPDAVSLILVALPLYLLYELGIRIAERNERKKQIETT